MENFNFEKADPAETFDTGNFVKSSELDSYIVNCGIEQIQRVPLTISDLQKLATSFITEETAKQAQLFRVTNIEGAQLVHRKVSANIDYADIVFPYFLQEEVNPRECRLRRNNPDLEQTKGEIKEKEKYLSSPERDNMIFFPPTCRKEWLEDTAIPIVITEDEKITLALHLGSWNSLSCSVKRPHFIPFELGGVWNFRGTIGKVSNAYTQMEAEKGSISDFQLIDWENRQVTILFDAKAANRNLRKAHSGFARELKDLGENYATRFGGEK